MSLPLPSSLSPSKVSSFKDCALAFRFSAIDKLPEPPSAPATKGTLVHRALQLLFWDEPQGGRTLPVALAKLERAKAELDDDPEFTGLELSDEEREAFYAEAGGLVRKYFELEDPNEVRVIGTEIQLSVQLGTLLLRGIIDRLELDDDGELVVTDYKTGRAPSEPYERTRMSGVHFYAFLCERVLGRRPARVQLLHLQEPVAISTVPSDQSIRAMELRTRAIWTAVERACAVDDFRPRPGRLCDFCSFKSLCPAWGGSIDLVSQFKVEARMAAAGQDPLFDAVTPAAIAG
ncbi:MAG TPA: PD-(D/E)XK nuclease family protein [Acidimicrobiales bacterium]